MRIYEQHKILNNHKYLRQSPKATKKTISFKSARKAQIEFLKTKAGFSETFFHTNPNILNQFSDSQLNKIGVIVNKLNEIFSNDKVPLELIMVDLNPDFDSLEKLIDHYKKKNIPYYYLTRLIQLGKSKGDGMNTNFKILYKFLSLRENAVSNRRLLNKYDSVTTINDVDNILFRTPEATWQMLDILGEKAFVYSFKEKKDNLTNYIIDIGLRSWRFDIYAELKKLTNPRETVDFQQLEQYITFLKKKFGETTDSELQEDLKNEINLASKIRNDMIRTALKDPKDIFEMTIIVNALNNNGLYDDAAEMIKLLKNYNSDGKEKINQFLNQKLYDFYEIPLPNEAVLKNLDFSKSKYLAKLFYAKQDFKKAFKSLVELFSKNPGRNNKEIFDSLPCNIKTKEAFQELGFNYNNWCEFNPSSYIDYNNVKNNKIRIQKADMNNIPHSLFLGEDANCCTKTNGAYGSSSISYIICKMFQAIEVYHNNMSIGNVMCYLAKVNGIPSLILDNIEIKPQYEKDELIKNGIFNYAKFICKDIGAPNMPIFLTTVRNDINTQNLKFKIYELSLIGNSDPESPYLDFLTGTRRINDSTSKIGGISLYEVHNGIFIPEVEIEPITGSGVNLYLTNTNILTQAGMIGGYREIPVDREQTARNIQQTEPAVQQVSRETNEEQERNSRIYVYQLPYFDPNYD